MSLRTPEPTRARPPDRPPARVTDRRPLLRGGDVLGAGALRALTDLERDAVALPERIERRARARGLMEEVLRAVGRGDEAEAAVGQSLDGASG